MSPGRYAGLSGRWAWAAATHQSWDRRREVADELIAWVEETGVDGFNLSRVVTPETLVDFVDLVVPILQERGVYKQQLR